MANSLKVMAIAREGDEWHVDFNRGMHYHEDHEREYRHIRRYTHKHLLFAIIRGVFDGLRKDIGYDRFGKYHEPHERSR